jgi:hypothetical protein
MRRFALSLCLVLAAASGVLAQVRQDAQPAAAIATVPTTLSTTTCPGSGCVPLDVTGYASVGIQITGTWTGTHTFEGSVDAATYQALNCVATNGSSAVTTTTSNGVWVCSAAGLKSVRVRFSTASSGSSVVTLQAALAGGGSGGGGGGGSSVTINDPSVTTQKAAVNASGQLSITCANCSGSGASAVDNSVFTAGATSGAPAMGFYHSTIDAVTDGDTATFAMDSKRSQFIVLRDAAGNARGVNVTAGNALTVDASATTQPVSAASLPLPTGAATATLQGVTDADDASIATGQTVSLHASETMVYDGSVWRRMTFGTAGTASAQVWTVQGVASMTPVQVSQATAANLNATVVGTGTFVTQSAATIADGADVTLGAKADAKSTATDTTAVTLMQVVKEISAMEQAPASRAVTNAGTFATQSAITAASGSIASGAISSGAIASGAIASGAVASGAYASGSISDGAVVTLGNKTDAKSTSTDGTSVSIMQVLKEISAMEQSPAALPANQSVNVAQVGGNAISTGVGAAGTGTARVVDVASGTTGSAPPTQAGYIGGIGSGATGGLLTGVTVCDTDAKLDMTTATTTEIVALTSSRKVRVCSYTVEVSGTAVVTFKYGTGSNCGTGTTALGPAWDLTAQTGLSHGTGFGEVFRTPVSQALCVTSSAAVNVHVWVNYAVY